MEIKLHLDREGRAAVAENMWRRYVRAERLLAANAADLTSDMLIQPRWIGESGRFWYRWKSLSGVEFLRVDPATGDRGPAFDHDRLAAALSLAAAKPCAAAQLPFTEIEFAADESAIEFDIDGDGRWSCDLESYVCERVGDKPAPPGDAVRSPDGQWEAFTRDCNVWLRSVETGDERALTSDGVEKNGYGEELLSPLTTGGIADPPPPWVLWSPDSGKLLFCRVDQRDAPQFHLVQSVPKDGEIRPNCIHSLIPCRAMRCCRWPTRSAPTWARAR